MRSNRAEEHGKLRRFFKLRARGKELKKAAVYLAMATHTNGEFYLNLPVSEFLEINNEVAEAWEEMAR